MFEERFILVYFIVLFSVAFFGAAVADATKDVVGYFRGRRIR